MATNDDITHAPESGKWVVVSSGHGVVVVSAPCVCGDEDCGWSLSAAETTVIQLSTRQGASDG